MENIHIDSDSSLSKKMRATDGTLLETVQQLLAHIVGKERCDELDKDVEKAMSALMDSLDKATKSDAEMILCIVGVAINAILTFHYAHDTIMLHRELDQIEKG